MLEALYIHSSVEVGDTQTASFNNLAHIRCELDDKDSADAIMSPRNTLHMLRIVFDSAKDRDDGQKLLHDWSPLFDPEEAEAVRMITRWSGQSRHDLSEIDNAPIPDWA